MGMFDQQNPYQTAQATFDGYGPQMAYLAEESERTTFIRRTYAHLACAVAMFVALETLYFTIIPAATLDGLMRAMFSSKIGWIAVMISFVGVSWIANSWAQSSTSKGMQYAGLFLYVAVESVVFLPMLYIAQIIDPAGKIIPNAGLLTLIVFGGLTAMVFLTRADFSWMGKFLFWAGIVATGAVICFAIFGEMGIGLLFTVAMIGLASGYILYDTSNVLHHYRTDQHVAASLALFASVALLFWYILQLFMRLQSRD